jgi:hypothetical protein
MMKQEDCKEHLKALRKELRNLIRAREPNAFELDSIQDCIKELKYYMDIKGYKYKESKYEG